MSGALKKIAELGHHCGNTDFSKYIPLQPAYQEL